MSIRENPGFISFVERHKGNITLALSLILYLASWPLALLDRTAGDIVRAAGEASLVGGLCDYIALNMIFEQHWYLPNSGVLPRNREKLIDGIANTIEREWLTPDMIGRKLHDLRPLDRLGGYLQAASLKSVIRPEQLERLCREGARYLEPDFADAVIQRVTSRMKPAGFIDRIRRSVTQTFARRECVHLREMLLRLPHDDELIATVDGVIHDFGEHLRVPDGVIRKTADHWMESLVREVVIASRGEIARMVKENLSGLSNETIRVQIESRTRTHLDWIRVNGGVFGAILGLGFALLNALRPEFQIVIRQLALLW
ncbi:MAG: DUF445 family protein [Candidatus Binataceae bacterium]